MYSGTKRLFCTFFSGAPAASLFSQSSLRLFFSQPEAISLSQY